MEKQVFKRINDMPKAYRATYLKALEGDSLRAAVNAQCLECMGWFRNEVRDCDCYECPLHTVRPYQSSQKSHDGGFIAPEAANSVQEVI